MHAKFGILWGEPHDVRGPADYQMARVIRAFVPLPGLSKKEISPPWKEVPSFEN